MTAHPCRLSQSGMLRIPRNLIRLFSIGSEEFGRRIDLDGGGGERLEMPQYEGRLAQLGGH